MSVYLRLNGESRAAARIVLLARLVRCPRMTPAAGKSKQANTGLVADAHLCTIECYAYVVAVS